jgi:C4-dicarboxylate-binding protein DctP
MLYKSRLTSRILLLGLWFLALSCSSPQPQAQPLVIKFSHVVAENTPKGIAANKFKELAERRLPGKVEVAVFPNSQLFNDDTVLQAMLLGDVHLAAPALSKFEKYTKAFQVFDLPFLFNNLEAVDRFQRSPAGQQLLTSLQNKGLLGLGYLHNGMKQISANRPLRVPDDARQLKFRIMASEVLAEQFRVLDAMALKKPFSEVFTLLQTRAIDGQENTWSNIYSQKFHEVQGYITETNHGLLDYLVVTSVEFWQGLPANMRGALEAAMQEAIAVGNQAAFTQEKEDREAIQRSGRSQILVLTAEEQTKWRDAMRPVWDKFAGSIGQDLIEAALAANQTPP